MSCSTKMSICLAGLELNSVSALVRFSSSIVLTSGDWQNHLKPGEREGEKNNVNLSRSRTLHRIYLEGLERHKKKHGNILGILLDMDFFFTVEQCLSYLNLIRGFELSRSVPKEERRLKMRSNFGRWSFCATWKTKNIFWKINRFLLQKKNAILNCTSYTKHENTKLEIFYACLYVCLSFNNTGGDVNYHGLPKAANLIANSLNAIVNLDWRDLLHLYRQDVVFHILLPHSVSARRKVEKHSFPFF